MEKAGRVNRDVGLFAIAIGAFVSQILIVAGIVNVIQGILVENYFKNKRFKKQKTKSS